MKLLEWTCPLMSLLQESSEAPPRGLVESSEAHPRGLVESSEAPPRGLVESSEVLSWGNV